jgi:putative ubiquitin-RnfH superfamily antitoxin RatB of RatAB toxin-antitoxin module
MRIEVVYARPERQRLVTVELAAGATARDAVRASGLAAEFPGDDLEQAPLGVFGRDCADGTVLRAGDRVEIYRPLQVDPKEARRRRAGRP